MATALQVSRLTKSFRQGDRSVPVLEDVSFTLEQGDFVCLLGPSGCGKSTLLAIVAGLDRPDAGTVDPADRLGRFGYMPQRDLLLPWRTLEENVILGLLARGVPRAQARRQAAVLAARFGLAGFESTPPHALSGGMRQRAALLRTALAGQEVWLLDEPFGALDALTRGQLQQWLAEVRRELGKTVLFVTHDVNEALFLGDRVLLLSGRPARVVLEAPVPLPRPRRLEDLDTPAAAQLRQRLLAVLDGGARPRAAG